MSTRGAASSFYVPDDKNRINVYLACQNRASLEILRQLRCWLRNEAEAAVKNLLHDIVPFVDDLSAAVEGLRTAPERGILVCLGFHPASVKDLLRSRDKELEILIVAPPAALTRKPGRLRTLQRAPT